MAPGFGDVAAPLHRAPSPASGPRPVEEARAAGLGGADPDPITLSGTKHLRRIQCNPAERVPTLIRRLLQAELQHPSGSHSEAVGHPGVRKPGVDDACRIGRDG